MSRLLCLCLPPLPPAPVRSLAAHLKVSHLGFNGANAFLHELQGIKMGRRIIPQTRARQTKRAALFNPPRPRSLLHNFPMFASQPRSFSRIRRDGTASLLLALCTRLNPLCEIFSRPFRPSSFFAPSSLVLRNPERRDVHGSFTSFCQSSTRKR